MAKQVEETVTIPESFQAKDDKMDGKHQQQSKNLYMSVKTFDGKTGKDIGERIVDLFHYGTRNWLANHTWWAMHNGHEVVQSVATDEEIGRYLFEQEKALQEKFGAPRGANDLVTAESIAA